MESQHPHRASRYTFGRKRGLMALCSRQWKLGSSFARGKLRAVALTKFHYPPPSRMLPFSRMLFISGRNSCRSADRRRITRIDRFRYRAAKTGISRDRATAIGAIVQEREGERERESEEKKEGEKCIRGPETRTRVLRLMLALRAHFHPSSNYPPTPFEGWMSLVRTREYVLPLSP
jgi:hypothetical protein